MRVQKAHANSRYEFALLDDEGFAIPAVTDFLGAQEAVRLTPSLPTRTICNTSFNSSSAQRFTIRSSRHNALWTSCNTFALYPVAAKRASVHQGLTAAPRRSQSLLLEACALCRDWGLPGGT